MPRIALAHTTDLADPTMAFAADCWRAWPKLSPNFWRETHLGTVGKVALRAEEGLAPMAIGRNLVVGWAADVARWQRNAETSGADMHAAVALGFCQATTYQDSIASGLSFTPMLVVNEDTDAATLQAAFAACERQILAGQATCYGICAMDLGEADTHWPLDRILQLSHSAAEQAWGRKKRSGLRVLVTQIGLNNLNIVTMRNTAQRDERMSPLELAARLGLMVVAEVPDEANTSGAAGPDPAALQALVQVATCEQALNRALGGWPSVNGQAVWSAVQLLHAGMPPWPTLGSWVRWQGEVWPELQRVWAQLDGGAAREKEVYMRALDILQPHGAALAAAAAWQHMTQAVDARWQAAPARVRVLGMLSSIPGLTAVVPAVPLAEAEARLLQELGDWPDPAGTLAGFAH